jgi:endonuclease-3
MKTKSDAASILRKLEGQHPNADTELVYRNAFELLVATILSAQTTDVGVNSVTPALFERFPTARELAAAAPADVEPIIQKTGFFRQKAKAIIGMAQGLVERHGGAVPPDMDALTGLPGVGRKTANVVLAHALNVPGLPVDRHVLRVANRLGLARSQDPEAVEEQLNALYPPASWRAVSDTFILHGRRICKPQPLCDRCAVRQECDYYRGLGATAPAPRAAARKRAASPAPAAGGTRRPQTASKARSAAPSRRPRRK